MIKLFKRRKLKAARKKQLDYWDHFFEKAKERSDYEEIYSKKEEWLKVLEIQTPPVLEFTRIMQSHQYKENWENFELQDVKTSFENIRGIFR